MFSNCGNTYVPSWFGTNSTFSPFIVIFVILKFKSGVIVMAFDEAHPYSTVSYGISPSPDMLPPFISFTFSTSVVILNCFRLFNTVISFADTISGKINSGEYFTTCP